MKKWILKATVQKGISFLPGKHRINFLFQKHVTKGVQLTEAYLVDRLTHFQAHKRLLTEQSSHGIPDRVPLELGTGWYPIVPLCFFLSGASHCYTVDISALMNKERLWETIQILLDYDKAGKLAPYVPNMMQERRDRLAAIQAEDPFETMLAKLQLQYIVADARQLPLEDDSVDFITSNNTFEHIYPDILADILKEFQRVLKPNGRMCHFIDMSDHFAHLDSSITIYNFLQFTERQWKYIDNDVQPQNRWRMQHYRQLYQQLQIPILKEENRPGSVEEVRQVPLAPPFDQLPEKEVAISHGYVVS
jgi:SAM-dependent methyltransferase